MMILGCYAGQSLLINDDVEVVILEHHEDGVRVGLRVSNGSKVQVKEQGVRERLYDE